LYNIIRIINFENMLLTYGTSIWGDIMEQLNFEFHANPNKKVEIQVGDKTFLRHAIRTHFVSEKENYIEVVKQYAGPIYEEGDIVSISEKIIAMCQNRVLNAKDLKLSFWAKFLSRFVNVTPAGESVGNPYKMQIAINSAGLLRILFAAACAAVGKLFGVKGVFYRIAGNGVSGIDGFCRDAFDYYLDKGILNPENPNGVCDEIKEKLGIDCMIVDANDLGVEILGKSSTITYSENELMGMIKDNPAGQANQQTPMILIREQKEIGVELAAVTVEV
jgi:F420-0:gamma-glutamyl ligase-like protein